VSLLLSVLMMEERILLRIIHILLLLLLFPFAQVEDDIGRRDRVVETKSENCDLV